MNKDNEQKRFEGTMAAVDDAILAAKPAEIAEELRALGIEPGAAVTAMRARIEAVVRARGKKLMKSVAEQVRRDRGLKVILPGGAQRAGDLRAKLARLLLRPGVPTTLAARDGRSMSDADVESLIQDLAELGITEDEER
jgi:hypothetical protein